MVSPLLQSFQAASNNFTVVPLLSEKDLAQFKVEYAPNVLDKLEKFVLYSPPTFNKIIFTGHRGCGKSTLLAELARKLEKEHNYFVVFFSIAKEIGTFQVDHIDILYYIVHCLIKQAEQNQIKINPQLQDSFNQWFATRSKISQEQYKAEVSSGFDLFKIIAGKMTADAHIRYEIKQELRNHFPDLIKNIDDIVKAISQQINKKVLVIIDDIDKLDLANVRNIFQENIKALFSPNCPVIFTIPISAYRDVSLKEIIKTETNNQIALMTVSKLFENHQDSRGDNKPNSPDFHSLKELITLRINSELIEQETLEEIVRYSGGLLRDVVRITSECCQIAIGLLDRQPHLKNFKINDAILTEVIQNLRLDYETSLGKKDYEMLQTTYKNFEPDDSNEERFLVLLHGVYVLEYRNGEIWYDVHPIVVDLLKQKGKL